MQQSVKSCDEQGSDEDIKDRQQFGLKGETVRSSEEILIVQCHQNKNIEEE
jgi:hypothetical protein